MKARQTTKQADTKGRRKVLEQLIANTRIMRKSDDLTQVEEATVWEKQLRDRLNQLPQEEQAAAA